MNVRLLLKGGAVVELELEEYLRGVVPAEMGARQPMEALKAQAVAARSFAAVAALERPRHRGEGADLCTEAHCQAWRPERAHARTDAAVGDTAGLVIVYQGHVAQAFYSARCGGLTRAAWVPGAAPWCGPVECPCGGKRVGHGIGMCQVGAYRLADTGLTFEEILRHYYSGVEIVPIEE